MLLVPSHKYYLLKEASSNTRLPIESYSSNADPSESPLLISRTDPALALVRLLTQRFLIFCCSAIHLLAGVVGQAIDPRAQPGGIYDTLQEIAVECRTGTCNRRRDGLVASSHLA